MKYEGVDNFLDQQDFNNLEEVLFHEEFPLFLQKNITFKDKSNEKGVFFTHVFQHWGKNEHNTTEYIFHHLQPVLNKLKPQKLLRLQFNLHPRTFIKRYNPYHQDNAMSHKGCLLYMNTNNGNTILKTGIFGKKIKSIANRALLMDPSDIHRSTTCTDADYRGVLVINYL